ncbi:MAG: CDP-alcohol phosphatidyltransferase family protein [Oscillospiraceae bacterium]|nr:CDP-alcohol phosphatidyltransferase family protein [Oscillospiraceae bacterium]
MIGFYNYTVLLTYIGFACGSCGIYFAATGRTHAAIVALLLAGFCDMFDGKIAKTKKDRTDQEKRFGIQIDSLSDMVCFGILPPMIAFSAGLHSALHVAVFTCFSLAALIRLAYFNVTEEERQQVTTERRKVYEGLPVTSTALIIPLLFCFHAELGDAFPIVAAVVYGLIAVAFITRFTLKKPQMRAMLLFILVGALELILLLVKLRAQKNG